MNGVTVKRGHGGVRLQPTGHHSLGRPVPIAQYPEGNVRNVEVASSSPVTSTIYFGGPRRKPTISWAFLLFQRIPPDLSTGLSTEYVDGLSKLP